MSDDFSTYVERERARIAEARENLLTERRSIDARMDALDKDFAAIDAYEAAKTGKATKAHAPRVRSSSRREEILTLLGLSPSGMTRGKLLVDLGVKGDKSGEMSVSNALTAMQRAGQIVRQPDRRWTIVHQSLQTAAE